MIKNIISLFAGLFLVISTYADGYSIKPLENMINVVSTNSQHSFILRPVGTSPLTEIKDTESLPAGFKYQAGSGQFSGLNPATQYIIDEYIDGKLSFTEPVSTLAIAPSKPANAIVFAGNFIDRIALGLNSHGADNVLIIASKNKLQANQLARTDYAQIRKIISDPNFVPGFGQNKAKIDGNTYIVHAGKYKSPEVLEIMVPDFAEYTFAVVAYNGEGPTANFNVMPTKNSIRSKYPMMPPPIAVDPVVRNYEDGYFMAKWKKLPVEANYIISVATDPAFKNILADYDETDFGNIDEAPVMFEDNSKLYYRVKAVAGRTRSDWSNTVMVEIE